MKILCFHAHAGDSLSIVIKALTRSSYCHAALLIDDEKWAAAFVKRYEVAGSGHLIVEEYFPHVRARFLQPSDLASIDVFDVPSVTPPIQDTAMAWATQYLDARVAYGVVDLFKFLPISRSVLGEDNDQSFLKHSICSQFVFNVYRMGGLKLLNCHDYEVSPDKLPWSPLVVPAPALK